jgi:hypothetical protein
MEVVFIATGVTGDGKTQMKPLVAGDKVSEETRDNPASNKPTELSRSPIRVRGGMDWCRFS